MAQSDRKISVAIAGDCSNWNQNHTAQEDIPTEIREIIGECDVFVFNLEGPIINDSIKPEGFVKNTLIEQLLKKMGKFQPIVTNTESILDLMSLAGINVACLANNHMLDAGKEGVAYTLQTLKKRNFQSLGAGINHQEASSPLIIEVKGKKIGFLNYNFIGWKKFGIFIDPFAAGHNTAGVNHGDPRQIVQDIEVLRSTVDYIIIILHAGKQLQKALSPKDNQFFQSLNADCVVVHHPHISQNDCSSNVFSVGDFLFLYPEVLPNRRESKILQINLDNTIDIEEYNIKITSGLPCLRM